MCTGAKFNTKDRLIARRTDKHTGKHADILIEIQMGRQTHGYVGRWIHKQMCKTDRDKQTDRWVGQTDRHICRQMERRRGIKIDK
jgi:hypothetical protein